MLSSCQRLLIFKVLRTSGLIKEIGTNSFKHATFIYAINSICKLVRLARLVEQWSDNPEAEGSSPPSNHLTFGCLRNSY